MAKLDLKVGKIVSSKYFEVMSSAYEPPDRTAQLSGDVARPGPLPLTVQLYKCTRLADQTTIAPA